MDKGSAGTCPICGRGRAARPHNAAFPFCSPRCRLADLGRWLDGAYRVAGPGVIDADERHATEEPS
jgi:endogenous inhibitor of DNA gyrase (YacG/DUF329 family)